MDFVSNKTIEKLKYDLVRDKYVTFEDIEHAQELAYAQNINIGQALINSGLMTEEMLLKFLEDKLHIPYVDLDGYEIDKRCLDFISFKEALAYKILPLFEIEDTLTVAMSDPLDLFAIENIIERTQKVIEPVITSESGILRKINEYYETSSKVKDIDFAGDADYDWREELHANDLSEENIQNILRAILKTAIVKNVHELYFEQNEENLAVKVKIGYDFQDIGAIPNLLANSFITKLKTISGLDPTVNEIPQLGKLNFNVDNKTLTASVSAFPTIAGERIALKIYHPPRNISSIFEPEKANYIKEQLNKSGVVLVCGGSLSGKTHLIYSMLTDLIPENKTVMTLESIAKYKIPNIFQCELSENIGFNLDKAMRFIEFQSPNIIYFEGISSKEGFDYFTSLALKEKTVITEFYAENIEDLRTKFSHPEFSLFKSVINTLIFIHNKDSIEIFDKENLKRYLL